MQLSRRDEQTLRYALADPPVRRMRRLAVIILAAIAVVAASARWLDPLDVRTLVVVLAPAAIVGWAAYWVGVDRGLDALVATGAARAWAGGPPGPTGPTDEVAADEEA